MIINARPMPIFLGICAPCRRPIRVTVEAATGDRHTVVCPTCMKRVAAQRLYATTTAEECHPRCMTATGDNCECGCSGWKHGSVWAATDSETVADEIEAWRARLAAVEARRASAAAARVRAFDRWADDNATGDVVAWLNSDDRPGGNEFVESLTQQVQQFRALTPRQVDGVRAWIDSAARRAAKRAEHEAERAAAQAERVAAGLPAVEPLPTGRAVQITGTVTRTAIRENQHARSGAAQYRMEVTGDAGWVIWSTVPAALKTHFDQLKGRRVTFVADVEATAIPTDGRASRPRKAALVEMATA